MSRLTGAPNKPLVPIRYGEAPLLAAQPQRWAGGQSRWHHPSSDGRPR